LASSFFVTAFLFSPLSLFILLSTLETVELIVLFSTTFFGSLSMTGSSSSSVVSHLDLRTLITSTFSLVMVGIAFREGPPTCFLNTTLSFFFTAFLLLSSSSLSEDELPLSLVGDSDDDVDLELPFSFFIFFLFFFHFLCLDLRLLAFFFFFLSLSSSSDDDVECDLFFFFSFLIFFCFCFSICTLCATLINSIRFSAS